MFLLPPLQPLGCYPGNHAPSQCHFVPISYPLCYLSCNPFITLCFSYPMVAGHNVMHTYSLPSLICKKYHCAVGLLFLLSSNFQF